MNLYEKNIKLLTQHYPGMDINLKNAKEQEDISVQEELSKDGEKILKITKKDIVVIWREKEMPKNHHMNGLKNRENFLKTIYIYLWE